MTAFGKRWIAVVGNGRGQSYARAHLYEASDVVAEDNGRWLRTLEVDLDRLLPVDATIEQRAKHARVEESRWDAELARVLTPEERYQHCERRSTLLAEEAAALAAKVALVPSTVPPRDEATELRAEVERMRPVVDAACRWKDVADDPSAPVWQFIEALDAAIDTYRNGAKVPPRPRLTDEDVARLHRAALVWLGYDPELPHYNSSLSVVLRTLLGAGKLGAGGAP